MLNSCVTAEMVREVGPSHIVLESFGLHLETEAQIHLEEVMVKKEE